MKTFVASMLLLISGIIAVILLASDFFGYMNEFSKYDYYKKAILMQTIVSFIAYYLIRRKK